MVLLDVNDCFKNLVEISYYFIQQSKTLDSFIIRFKLYVKFGKIRNGSKHDANTLALFVIEFLKIKYKLHLNQVTWIKFFKNK